MNTRVAATAAEKSERSNCALTPPTRISDHGVKVAAGRIGCTVEDYRQHEAAGEFWCGFKRHWVSRDEFRWTGQATNTRAGRCSECDNQDARQRYIPQRGHVQGLRGVRYAGPAFAKGQRVSLTPEGAASVSSVGHMDFPSREGGHGPADAAGSLSQHLVPSAVAVPSGHIHCPPSIRHLCEGRLPDGWIRERKEGAA